MSIHSWSKKRTKKCISKCKYGVTGHKLCDNSMWYSVAGRLIVFSKKRLRFSVASIRALDLVLPYVKDKSWLTTVNCKSHIYILHRTSDYSQTNWAQNTVRDYIFYLTLSFPRIDDLTVDFIENMIWSNFIKNMVWSTYKFDAVVMTWNKEITLKFWLSLDFGTENFYSLYKLHRHKVHSLQVKLR